MHADIYPMYYYWVLKCDNERTSKQTKEQTDERTNKQTDERKDDNETRKK